MDFGGLPSVPLTTVGNASMQGVGTEIGLSCAGDWHTWSNRAAQPGKKRTGP